MSKLTTYGDYMNMLSEKTLDNTNQLKKDIRQRRNGMEDLYGVCFSAHATEPDDGRYKARFYISLSPDYVYLHRFAFKFVIMPSITGEDPSEDSDWKVFISGVDITPYLKEQQDIDPSDPLFNGEGIYPSNGVEESTENFYDILDVLSVMFAEAGGDEEAETYQDASKILTPSFKPVSITSKKPFSVDAYLYMKYSNTNR